MTEIITLSVTGSPVTTSLAIAEGVGNPHASVIKLIRQNSSDLEEFGGVGFEIQPFETAGGTQNREVAILNEQQATLLLTCMRNNDVVRVFKKRLVKAFFEMRDELNRQQAPEVASLSRLEILQLAMQSEEERLILEKRNQELATQIELDAPKVDFASRVEISHDAISVGEAAKILGTGRNRLLAFLRQVKWVTRTNEPYQDKIETGLLDVKLGSFNHPDHGLKQSITTLITGKGLVRLRKLWDERARQEAA